MNNELKINPKVLEWARLECGYSKLEVADKIDVNVMKYDNWETTGTGINLNELRAISKICKRQIAFFFLPYVPPKTKKPTDYRNLEATQSKLTEKTLLAIRRTEKYQEFLLQQNDESYYKEKYKWILNNETYIKSNPIQYELITNKIRELLKIEVKEQIIDKITPEESYKKWRTSIENNLGINVFQFSMLKTEVQGFSYSSSYPYCIIINNTYPATSRTFTLFHELYHIIKNQSGLCKPHDTFLEKEDAVEYACNSFAGCLLIPSSEVIATKNKEKIFEYAQKFKVSSEVYLRRLFTLGELSENEFFNLLEQIRKSVITVPPHYSKNPILRAINSRGVNLFNTTIDAMNKKKISYTTASDILGLKINYIFSI